MRHDPFNRRGRIDHLRAQQDPFDRLRAHQLDPLDRHFDRVERMLDNPGKTALKFGALAIFGNILFWGFIIFMIAIAVKWAF